MHFIISLILNALALWIVVQLNIGVHADSLTALLIAAFVLGIVNAIIRPIVLLLSFPLVLLTLGLFALVVNALMLMLVSPIVPGFKVDGFGAAFIASLILAAISWAINAVGINRARA